MVKEEKISALISGGSASAGPPLGPALGPAGVNIGQVIAEINEKTKSFSGMQVPVDVYINPANKSFRIEVGSPPIAELLKSKANVTKFPGDKKGDMVDVSLETIKEVAEMAATRGNIPYKSVLKTVLGTCVSANVTIDGKSARLIQKGVDDGSIQA